MQHEFLALERIAQCRFEVEPACRARVEIGREEPERVPAGVLGVIHGGIGVLEQQLGVLVIERVERDADRGRHEQLLSGEQKRLGKHIEDFLGDAPDIVHMRHVRQHHGEFVTAEARDSVARTHAAGQTPGDASSATGRRHHGQGYRSPV